MNIVCVLIKSKQINLDTEKNKMKDYKKKQAKRFKNKSQNTFITLDQSGKRQDIITGIQQVNRLLNFHSVHNNLTPSEVRDNSGQLRVLYAKLWELDAK
jgi:hypothetical protein